MMLLSCGAFAADSGNKGWFETTIKGLKSKIARRYQASSVGAASVAAVRGADMKENTKDKVYWKGTQSDKRDKKLGKQRSQLAAALELAVSGKIDEAKKGVEKFIKDNPESPYLEDAKEALVRLKTMPAAPPETDAKDAAPSLDAAAQKDGAKASAPAAAAATVKDAAVPAKDAAAQPAAGK